MYSRLVDLACYKLQLYVVIKHNLIGINLLALLKLQNFSFLILIQNQRQLNTVQIYKIFV